MTLKRWTYLIGFLMVGIMGLSAVMPMMRNMAVTSSQESAALPTATAVPTLPPPPDTATLSFDQLYLHPSGLFAVDAPTGWLPSQPLASANEARAVFTNDLAQSIIQVDVDLPTTASDAPLTLDDVDARYNRGWLASSWSKYSSWEESSRQRTDDGHLVIDFVLTLDAQTYVARQNAWTDGDWIYSVRVVMPQNATDALVFILNGVAATLQPHKEFANEPFDWKAYFDQQDAHIIRFPSDWTLADSAPGRPTSIQGTDNTLLRVEAQAGTTVASEDAARSWVEGLRSGTDILSVTPVSRQNSDGYSVAYSYQTVDGDTESGLAVLLNGPNDLLHVANLHFIGDKVDLNSADAGDQYSSLIAVMNSFEVLPDLASARTN